MVTQGGETRHFAPVDGLKFYIRLGRNCRINTKFFGMVGFFRDILFRRKLVGVCLVFHGKVNLQCTELIRKTNYQKIYL